MSKEQLLEQICELRREQLDKLDKLKRASMMRHIVRKSIDEENELKARGLCPKCRIYLPLSGICDCEM